MHCNVCFYVVQNKAYKDEPQEEIQVRSKENNIVS